MTNAPYDTSAKDASGNPIKLTNGFENNNYPNTSLKDVAIGMNHATYGPLYLCDGNDVGTAGGKENNLLKAARDKGETPDVYAQLASDYIEIDNGDGTYSYELKTLKQKTIDMYYLIANSKEQYSSRGSYGNNEFSLTQDYNGDGTNDVTVASFLTDYVEGDMKNLKPPRPEPPILNATHPGNPPEPFTELPPVPPTPPEMPSNDLEIYDKELAQWYTNLWYAMDGRQQTGEVKSVHNNEDFSHYIVEEDEKTSKMIEDAQRASEKIQANQHYIIINKQDATDSSWIQYMLTSGAVTMKQAALRTTGYITWEGIEFSSTNDIREIDNNKLIAKAEAEYKESIAQIQAEDKILDAKNKKLDTEHTAIKSEIDSIKNVMSKNVEKSFSAFS